MMLTKEEYLQNNGKVQTTGFAIMDTSLQEFLKELVDNKKMIDIHILISFAFSQCSRMVSIRLFKILVGEISRHNVKIMYGADIEKLSVLVRLHINCNFDLDNGNTRMLRRALVKESANILRDDFNIRLNNLSNVEMNVLAFFINFIRMKVEYSHNLKPGYKGQGEFCINSCCVINDMTVEFDEDNEEYNYYEFDDLRKITIIFQEIFSQELENEDKIIETNYEEKGYSPFEVKINYLKFGDIIVKAGIGYWVANNYGGRSYNKLVVPKFLYEIASACDRIPLDIKDFDVMVKRMENILKGKDLDVIYSRDNDFDNKCISTDGINGIEDKSELLDEEDSIFSIDNCTEKDIEDCLCKNITVLEEGLKIERCPSGNLSQYPTDVGIIDILCKDRYDIYTVIEIKVRDNRDKVLAQIIRYMSWVKKHLARDNAIRGIIVVDNYDDILESMIELTNLDIKIKILNIK